MADEDESCADAILEAGGIPALLGLISNGYVIGEAEQVSEAFAQLAKSSDACAQAIVEAGAVPELVKLISAPGDESARMRSNAVFALARLAEDSES